MSKDELIAKVRTYLRDHDSLRVLLESEESTNDEIELAVDMALSDLNAEPPLTKTWTWDDYPLSAIIMASVGEVLLSVSIASTANRLPYSDGNVGNIDIESKAPQFAQMGQFYLDYAKRQAVAYKSRIDIIEILSEEIDSEGESGVGIPSGQF